MLGGPLVLACFSGFRIACLTLVYLALHLHVGQQWWLQGGGTTGESESMLLSNAEFFGSTSCLSPMLVCTLCFSIRFMLDKVVDASCVMAIMLWWLPYAVSFVMYIRVDLEPY